MILKSLQLKNFKQYGNLNLEFREGLIGIVGKNGSGKSSLFEAILLCLFGNISLDKNLYKSSWVTVKENILLELVFEVKGKVWRVRREFRGKALAPKAGLYDQEDKMIATDTKPVTAEIVKLLGMDKDAFTRSIFSGQKELGIISNTKGEERKRMVRKMVGLDRLDDIQKIIREDRNTLNKEMQGQSKLLLSEAEQEELEKQLKSLAKEIKTLEKEEEKMNATFSKKNKAYQESKKLFDEQSILNKQFNTLNNDLTRFVAGLENVNENLAKNKKEIERVKEMKKELKKLEPEIKIFLEKRKKEEALEKLRKQFEGQRKLVEKQKNIEEQEEVTKLQIEKLNARFPNIEKFGKEKKETLETCISQQETYEKEIAKFRTKIGTIKGKIEDRNQSIQQIAKIGKDANCPTCFQPLKDSYEATLNKLQQEIDGYEKKELQEIETKFQTNQKELEKTKTLKSNLEKEIATLRDTYKDIVRLKESLEGFSNNKKTIQTELKTLGKVDYDEAVHVQIKKEVRAFEEPYHQYKIIESKVAKLPELQEEAKSFKERSVKGTEMIKEQKTAIKALKFSVEKFAGTQKKMDTLEEEKDNAQESLLKQQKEIQKKKTDQQSSQKELDNFQKIKNQIAKSQDDFFKLDELNGIFQTFKTQILEKVRPSISHTASDLFQKITRGRYEGIEVDENFEFQILEDGQYYPITRFSGGEIDLANLCLRIGISRAIAELSGSEEGMSFLGFDEIFGSQDEDRRFEILKALDHLKEQYRQVYIVSHINSIKEHFPEILEVLKTEKGSEVNWLG